MMGRRIGTKSEATKPRDDRRDAVTGRFGAGNTANPGGRPRIPEDVKELTKLNSPDMVRVVLEIAKDQEQPAAARVAAANSIIKTMKNFTIN